MIGDGCWDWDHLKELILPHVLKMIAAILPPSDVMGSDQLDWEFSSSMTYKSLFLLQNEESVIWKKVWKVKMPQRVHTFLWLL